MDLRGRDWMKAPPQYLHAPACLECSMTRAACRRAPQPNAADALEWLAQAAVGLWDEERHCKCSRPASPFRNNLVTMPCAIEHQGQGRIHMLKDPNLRQIATWKLEGYTNAEIAKQLDCTLRTVQRKLDRIRGYWETAQE